MFSLGPVVQGERTYRACPGDSSILLAANFGSGGPVDVAVVRFQRSFIAVALIQNEHFFLLIAANA